MHDPNCSRCHQPIEEVRRQLTPVICGACGYVVPEAVDMIAQKKKARVTQLVVLAVAGLSLLAFMQASTWGKYALEMPVLKLKAGVGMASLQNLDRMAHICQELKRYDCIETAYSHQARMEPTYSRRLAEYQMLRHKFKDAALTLSTYLKSASKDIAALTLYARAMTELGQLDEAAQTFERALAVQTGKLQPELVKNYVKTLAKARRYAQAQAVILRMRREHAGAAQFMEQELRIIAELSINTGRELASKK